MNLPVNHLPKWEGDERMLWRCHMTAEEGNELVTAIREEPESCIVAEAVDLAYIALGNVVTTGQMFARRWPISSRHTALSPIPRSSLYATYQLLIPVHVDRVLHCWDRKLLVGWSEENAALYRCVRALFFLSGLPFAPFWQEVHRANMQKVPGLLRRKEQPQGWLAPDTARILSGLRQHD